MSDRDLGEMSGTLLFFGGPYSNLQATLALKTFAEHQGIVASQIICTGDTVAYCAQPNETVELLREWGVWVVMGNCEESLAYGAQDCGCGFEEGSTCNALAQSWYRYANERVDFSHRLWMRDLPKAIKFNYLGKRFAVIHGGVEKINQFIFSSTSTAIKRQELAIAAVDGIVAGHCGLPFTQVINDKVWHNPGVIGLPANDGTPRVWFSLWTATDGKLKISHRYLEYDAENAHAIMLQEGLDNGYAHALFSGLWPSMDVLPDEEKTRQACALSECVYLF